ncbi:MAG: nucleotidyl transferase AbiEii/AbiGii toxin family protein [Thermoleophilia bacterium]|nr:nucleotidyl transferase AbiEii/AbiGii toxin family protein [Thermoleophilia bacterium]
MGALGYLVQSTNDEHSGQTYRVKYPGSHVKVDVSYLARVPLLEPENRTCEFADPPISFPALRLPELVAGKIKAMMERLAARDLYDLYRLAVTVLDFLEDPLARALAVRAICTSDPFPFVTDPVVALERFRHPAPEFIDPLFAMLRADEAPSHVVMLEAVARWLSPLSSSSEAEREFMRLLGEDAVYRPVLLLAEYPGVLERASMDPVMAWKVQNLRQRLEARGT